MRFIYNYPLVLFDMRIYYFWLRKSGMENKLSMKHTNLNNQLSITIYY